MTTSPVQAACPLCGRDSHMGMKAKLLYGQPVCSKCYYAFANRRQFAFFLDIIIWSFVVGFGLVGTGLAADADTARGLGYLLFPIFGMKDGFRGQSPGKSLMGVQVADERSGQPGGFGAAFKRNLVLMVPFVPIIVAFTLAPGKRWGDGWARTRVIWKKYRDRAPFAFTPTGQG